MPNEIQKFFDTKTIIVNLLKEDKLTYLPIERLQKLLNYIYVELKKDHKLDDYRILFDVNFNAVERTVLYNEDIFILDIEEEMIYLRKSQSIEKLADQYQVDDTIKKIIKDFGKAA